MTPHGEHARRRASRFSVVAGPTNVGKTGQHAGESSGSKGSTVRMWDGFPEANAGNRGLSRRRGGSLSFDATGCPARRKPRVLEIGGGAIARPTEERHSITGDDSASLFAAGQRNAEIAARRGRTFRRAANFPAGRRRRLCWKRPTASQTPHPNPPTAQQGGGLLQRPG